MSLRESLNRSRVLSTSLSIVLLVVAGFVGYRALTAGGVVPNGIYFYDLESGELVSRAIDTNSPVKVEGRDALVRAVVFSCGICEDRDSRFIGYLEKYSDQALAVVQKGPVEKQDVPIMMRIDSTLVNLPEQVAASPWVPKESRAGNQIVNRLETMCNGGPPTMRCNP